MKNGLKKLFSREVMTYLIFGVLTTLVNYAVFALLIWQYGDRATLIANAVAWVAAVAFAYVTNKLFVFESKSWAADVLKREIPAFVGARLLSFGLEELGLWICKDLLHAGRWTLMEIGGKVIGGLLVSKVVLSILVVILNYFFSKLLIFTKKSEKQ